jgi:UDP-glucuronate 4-epimerase
MFDIVRSMKPDMVIHLAAMAGVRPSIEMPEKYISVNIEGTYNLLDAARRNDIGSFIFASSSSVYGGNRKIPFSEDDSVDNPVSPYAATKKAGELLCYTYHHLYKIDITCLRFFTVYGPRQRPEMAIYSFTEKIYKGEMIPLFSMGKSKRDYTFIDDIVDGILLSMQNMGGYRIYNLGESKVTDLLELLRIIELVTGKKADSELLPHQPGDMMITYADISRARKELGYDPQYDVEKGVREFVDWYTKKRKKEA